MVEIIIGNIIGIAIGVFVIIVSWAMFYNWVIHNDEVD